MSALGTMKWSQCMFKHQKKKKRICTFGRLDWRAEESLEKNHY